MYVTALSDHQLRISLNTLEEKGQLDSFLKRLKKKTIVAEKKEYVILFSSGPKKFEMLISRPFADKKEIEGMISQLDNELPEISISGDEAILTFK